MALLAVRFFRGDPNRIEPLLSRRRKRGRPNGRPFFVGMLVDRIQVEVRSGKGGDGCLSFRREKFVPKGGPDGGDGGDGGSVILGSTGALSTLQHLAGRHHLRAGNGEPGRSAQSHGKNGDDLLVKVPAGTIVFDDVTDELVADLDGPGKRCTVVQGGKGGYGNEHFKSSTDQAPRQVTLGGAAVERKLRLELKLIADVGLIGKPNAGKSTLLSRLSKARPKIADYPFTTLSPNLGIAELTGDRRLVFADIPGLIEGAAQGLGLGFDFLRHVERTRILVHLLEIEPTDGSDPMENYEVICGELAAYSPKLALKPQILVLTKMDLLRSSGDRGAAVSLIEQATGRSVVPISAVTGQGLADLTEACWRGVLEARSGTD